MERRLLVRDRGGSAQVVGHSPRVASVGFGADHSCHLLCGCDSSHSFVPYFKHPLYPGFTADNGHAVKQIWRLGLRCKELKLRGCGVTVFALRIGFRWSNALLVFERTVVRCTKALFADSAQSSPRNCFVRATRSLVGVLTPSRQNGSESIDAVFRVDAYGDSPVSSLQPLIDVGCIFNSMVR